MTGPIPPDASPGSISGAKPLEADQKIRPSTSGTSFESYMQKGTVAPKGGEAASGLSPLELASSKGGQPSSLTFNSLMGQVKTAQDGLGEIEKQLKTPNLKLTRSQTHLLRNKLTDAQGHTRDAAAQLGIKNPPLELPSQGGVLTRFLGYINDGQDQLVAVQNRLQELSKNKEQISPVAMMRLQAQMGLAQQEIEFSSTLLSKVISSITTLMQIQI